MFTGIAGCTLEKWYLHVLQFQNTVRDVDWTVKRIHEVKAQYTVVTSPRPYMGVTSSVAVCGSVIPFAVQLCRPIAGCSSLRQTHWHPCLRASCIYVRQSCLRRTSWPPKVQTSTTSVRALVPPTAGLRPVRPAAARFLDIAMTSMPTRCVSATDDGLAIPHFAALPASSRSSLSGAAHFSRSNFCTSSATTSSVSFSCSYSGAFSFDVNH